MVALFSYFYFYMELIFWIFFFLNRLHGTVLWYCCLSRHTLVCLMFLSDSFPFRFAAVKDVFIVAAKRTPFGTYGGSLANFTAIDLQEIASRAALTAGGIKPELINSVIVGSVFYVSSCIHRH